MKRHWKTGSLAILAAAFLTAAPGLSARDRDNNPPGPAGGKGTNWENPPGPEGGAGAGPDRRDGPHHHRRHHHFCKNHPDHPSCRGRNDATEQ